MKNAGETAFGLLICALLVWEAALISVTVLLGLWGRGFLPDSWGPMILLIWRAVGATVPGEW